MNNTQDNKLNEVQQAPIIYAREFWKSKFGEYPTNDADKLACVMMREYANQFQLDNKQVGAGVWVKPIEEKDRPPKFSKKVIVRSLFNEKIKLTDNLGHNTGWDIGMDDAFKWDNTEWLNETQSTTPISNEAINEIFKRLELHPSTIALYNSNVANCLHKDISELKAALQQSSGIDKSEVENLLHTILNCSKEEIFINGLHNHVVQVDHIKTSFYEYFGVKEIEPEF